MIQIFQLLKQDTSLYSLYLQILFTSFVTFAQAFERWNARLSICGTDIEQLRKSTEKGVEGKNTIA